MYDSTPIPVDRFTLECRDGNYKGYKVDGPDLERLKWLGKQWEDEADDHIWSVTEYKSGQEVASGGDRNRVISGKFEAWDKNLYENGVR